MAIITQAQADSYRTAYRNASFSSIQQQKNLEAALFDLDEVQNLIDSVKGSLPVDANGRKYLKLFLVYDANNDINLCMTGGERGRNLVNPAIGKPEFHANLDGDNQNIDDVLIALPCPPHCGQDGLSPNGLDNKYVTV